MHIMCCYDICGFSVNCSGFYAAVVCLRDKYDSHSRHFYNILFISSVKLRKYNCAKSLRILKMLQYVIISELLHYQMYINLHV